MPSVEPLIKGSSELNKMFVAVQRTGSSLRRDFGEVESLQQSLRGARDFVAKAAARIEESILSDLVLVRPNAGLLTPNMSRVGDGRDEFVLAMSGAHNFVRGDTRWAISLALRSNDETKIGLIYSPIDERLYYAEAGRGAYAFSAFHSARIKVSNIAAPSDVTVAYNTAHPGESGRCTGQGVLHRAFADLPADQIRMTGCPALDMAFVAAGKFDAFVSDYLDFAEIAAADLIVREAGGKIDMQDGLVVSNGKLYKIEE